MFDANNGEGDYVGRKVDDRGRLRCPMCRGRGYFEPTEQDPTEYFLNEDLKRPLFSFKQPPSGNKECVVESSSQKFMLPPIQKENHVIKRRSSNNRLQTDFAYKHDFSKTPNSDDGDYDILLPSPKTPKNPHEFLKSSLARLKGTDWNESLTALIDIIQISRYQPDILEGSMAVIHRSIISLLKGFRSKITRTACQVVSELFSNMPNTQRPGFDELISVLLQRTADTNKFVRRDANEALDSIVINVHPMHSVRTLVQKGITHRNAIVRTTAARLLVCTVGLVGVNNIFQGNKETRSRILNAGAQCLQDGCREVRMYGCHLMKMLMEHEDFDEVLQANVNSVLVNRIEKTLITLKYKR